MSNVIDSFSGKYHFLSNFSECGIQIGPYKFIDTESAFQGLKSDSPKEMEDMQKLKSSVAKKQGLRVHMRSNWEEVKVAAMFYVNMCKYTRYPELREKLLYTRDAYLIEGNTWGDKYWGQVNGVGRNMLGKVLMAVRRAVQKDRYPICVSHVKGYVYISVWPAGKILSVKVPAGISENTLAEVSAESLSVYYGEKINITVSFGNEFTYNETVDCKGYPMVSYTEEKRPNVTYVAPAMQNWEVPYV